MAYKKQQGGPKMYRKDGALPMKSPMKNINNMKEYSKSGDAVQFGDAPTDMNYGKGPQMQSSGFKMKSGSPMKRNFGVGNTPSPMKNLETYPVDFTNVDRKGKHKVTSGQSMIDQYNSVLDKLGTNQEGLKAFQKKYPTAAAYASSLGTGFEDSDNIGGDVARKNTKIVDGEEVDIDGKQITYQRGANKLMTAIQNGTVDKNNLSAYIEEGFTNDDRAAILQELESSGIVDSDVLTGIKDEFAERQVDNDAEIAANDGVDDDNIESYSPNIDNEDSKEVQKQTVIDSFKRKNKGASTAELEKMYAEYLEDLKAKSAGENLDTFTEDNIGYKRGEAVRGEQGFKSNTLLGGGLDINKKPLTIK